MPVVALDLDAASNFERQQQRLAMLRRFRTTVAQEYYEADAEVELPSGNESLQIARTSAGALTILRYTSPGSTAVKRGWRQIRHDCTDFYVIWFVKSGQIDINQHGRSASVGQGEVAVSSAANPFTIRSKAARSGNHESWQLLVPPHLIKGLLPDIENSCARTFAFTPGVELAFGIMRLLLEQADTAPAEMTERLGKEALDAVAFFLASEGKCRNANPVEDDWRIAIDLHLQRHLGEQGLNAERVASVLGISPSYLRKLYARSGKRFSDVLWELRLRRAYQLLSSDMARPLPISEVATLTGFRSAAHFSRTFRTRFAICPRQLRNRTDDLPAASADRGIETCTMRRGG
jgi:AraC-like DNA-binding protein